MSKGWHLFWLGNSNIITMKNNKYFKALIAFGLILTFSSCSTSNEVASNRLITKRKHNTGYHINWPSQWKKTKKNLAETDFTSQKEQIAVFDKNSGLTDLNQAFEIESQDEFVTVIEDEVIPFSEEKKNIETGDGLPAISKSHQELTSSEPINKETIGKTIVNEGSSKEPVDDDMLILLVILCFFLPFVAVGIKTDWDVKKVVINVLLCLLCGIPGIIHALIVVLND